MLSETPWIVAHENTQVFLQDKWKTNCSRCVFHEWTTAEFTEKMKIAWVDSGVKLASCDWRGLPLEVLEKVSEQALGCHSKGGHVISEVHHYDERRSPWWASRDGPKHDRSCSHTIMFRMEFNSYASLATFFIIPVLLCFVFERETIYYTSVTCVWFLLPHVSLQSNCVWKPSKLRLSISFSLWEFSSLLSL